MYTTLKPDRNRPRTVVFYGRVSTEHEAQMSALENQLQWYDDQAKHYANWNVIGKYIDEGITGTQAKKRPSFLQMIEDARRGRFDLIVTREVCRFARNTVDTLTFTRELKNLGIEVYFVEDNIWTMDGDGELRLTLMATLAQDESRKVSERVRAGQYISRENGVLYGNGNILGYDRNGPTYVINPEQAETVKIIFDMYLSGLGCKKIVNELTIQGRKNASGIVKWAVVNVSRILKNATYKGYIGYNKSYCNNYLEQKRITNHDEKTYTYVKGDFAPIISEEQWNACDKIRKQRTKTVVGKNGKERSTGSHTTKHIWVSKLRCSCGSHFSRYKWRTNKKDSTEVYGYQCGGRHGNASKRVLDNNGLDTSDICSVKAVCEWKLEYMAQKILGDVLNDKREVIEQTVSLINKYAVADSKDKSSSQLEEQVEKLEVRKQKALDLYLDGDLSKNDYNAKKNEIEKALIQLKEQLNKDTNQSVQFGKIDESEIRKYLDELLELPADRVPDKVIEKFISKVTPLPDGTFVWIINIGDGETEKIPCTITGRKDKAVLTIGDSECCRVTYFMADILERFIEVNVEKTGDTCLQHRLLLQISKSSDRLALSWNFGIKYDEAKAFRRISGNCLRIYQ